MGQRKNPRVEADEDCEPLPPPPVPVAVTVGNERVVVVLDAPTHEPRSGACRCGACLAAALADQYQFV